MSDFTPRLTDAGIVNNPHYYSRNPFYEAGYGMPNCTAYAWGRSWEIADPNNEYINRPPLSTGNAEDWFNFNDGWERGTAPALGAILCLADGPFSGDGHVCVVEQINDDLSIVTSDSEYSGAFFRTVTRYPDNNYIGVAGYIFQGFIYNPFAGDTPTPPGDKIKTWLLLKAAQKLRGL